MKLNFLIPVLPALLRRASTSIRKYSTINSPPNSFAYGMVDADGLQGLPQNYLPLRSEFQCSSWCCLRWVLIARGECALKRASQDGGAGEGGVTFQGRRAILPSQLAHKGGRLRLSFLQENSFLNP